MLKLVIFDLDGTLVDAYQAVSSSLNYTLAALGFPTVEDEMIKRSVGWGERHLIAKFFGDRPIEEALAIYRQHHTRALKMGVKFLPGARELLSTLKGEGYKLAIASNRPTDFTYIILQQLKMNHFFDVVLCGDKVARPKPSADILVKILKQLRIPPDQALYVGDMTIDVETGAKAGVKTVAVVTGSSLREELVDLDPFHVIDDLAEVAQIAREL